MTYRTSPTFIQRVRCCGARALGMCTAVLGAVAAPAFPQSQGTASGAQDAAAAFVARIEANGASHARCDAPESPGANFLRQPPGTAERRCVEGTDRGPVRSGEFVIGGQLGGSGARAGRPQKIWWAPLHQWNGMPSLTVSAHNLSNPGQEFRFVKNGSAFTVVPGSADSEREYFFPSGITMPQAGRWLLVATNGANWGCFILTVG